MTDSNVVSIIGRLTGDCEISKGTNGNMYGRFSIAVNRSYLAGGDWHDETSFFDCCMFGDICGVKGPYLQKGKRVSVVGSLRQSRWEKDGKKFSKVEILVNQIQFLDVQSAARPAGQPAQASSEGAAPVPPVSPDAAPQEGFAENGFTEDIPF